MRQPSVEEEMLLHQRLLEHDPLAYRDVFSLYMEPLARKLEKGGYDVDIARDAAIDALLVYRQNPERYDPQRAHPFAYIMGVARYKAMDRRSSQQARVEREKKQGDVELLRRTPKEQMEAMEIYVRVSQLLKRLIETGGLGEQDWAILQLYLTGEGSTEEFARVLRMSSTSKEDRKAKAKQLRDRLMKKLARFGRKEDSDDDDS